MTELSLFLDGQTDKRSILHPLFNPHPMQDRRKNTTGPESSEVNWLRQKTARPGKNHILPLLGTLLEEKQFIPR